jgi:hypothetical protein
MLFMRYMAASLLEDAADLAGRDEASANLFLSRAVFESLQVYCIALQRYLPRSKELNLANPCTQDLIQNVRTQPLVHK